jgi:ribosomal protein S18 acetylase RimI-like enzyme
MARSSRRVRIAGPRGGTRGAERGAHMADMEGAVRIRSYRPGDREAVRDICHRTGYMGEPADWYWRDLPSFAAVWTGYYTDREPESAFVAERDGRVVGYLLGCVDTARAPSATDAILRQAARRLLLLRPGTAGFFWRSLGDVLWDARVPPGELRDPRWPSHLHIDLLPEGRGVGAGSGLMRAWLERLSTLGSPGCHLVTLAENRNAIAFFERMGFRRHGPPSLLPGMRTRKGARMHEQILVREVSGGVGSG